MIRKLARKFMNTWMAMDYETCEASYDQEPGKSRRSLSRQSLSQKGMYDANYLT